jgi:Ni/Co efflux regulator RcnB
MKMNRLLAALMTSFLALGVATPVLAAGDRGHDRPRHGWDDRGRQAHHGKARADHGRRDWRDDRRHHDNRRPVVVHHRQPAPRHVVYHPAPRPAWVRGHRYHEYYQGPVYVVNDYGRHHLRRPPHGHHWIRSDRGDMLLVAVATGIIADIILHH